jgi:bifunctional DNA-binding transcriptional regulator/antitoxin component of YhaV-PrlF toxin-antitoxin module
LFLVTFKYFLLFFVVGGCVEEFVVRVFKGGKVTVPKRLRELFGVEDGDYVRLALVEVMKKKDGGWIRRKVG